MELLADPWIAAQIDEAVAPYLGRLPAHEIAWMREQLAEVLASDPEAARVLRGALPDDPSVDESGEVVRGGTPGQAGPVARNGGRFKAG